MCRFRSVLVRATVLWMHCAKLGCVIYVRVCVCASAQLRGVSHILQHAARAGTYHENFRVCADNDTSAVYTGEALGGAVFDSDQYSGPYPFGIDPIWHGTRTELTFLNSVKMKMSIVMGIVHMTLGIIMSLFNHLFFRDRLSLMYEFIPQLIFLWSLFGYLSFLIIFKWIAVPHLTARAHADCFIAPGDPLNKCVDTITSTPDLYNVMIQMFLAPGSIGVNSMFDGQGFFQLVLVLAAIIAVPVMLLPKPLILKKRHQQRFQVRPRSTIRVMCWCIVLQLG